MRVPLVFPPNINVRIKAQNGNGFTVPTCGDISYNEEVVQQPSLTAGQYLAVRLYLRGYLCTMPV